ncbi:unnamed protein product [Anisakis simplex]|uniref:Col_cuticle_N domain-containing protein n=1 Tax=Anisakis simplex TaxID=6269 RepID=A0A0M3JN61_ANISI|nr:unnamed protein product [Anisakis simplex]
MKSYRNKLDNRLGACIIGCLLTIATVLTIYGLFHETVNDHLVEYITGTKQIIVQSLPPPTTRGTTLMPRSAEALLVEGL